MSDYSTCYTSRVLTRLVHQVRVYTFGAPTTYLRVQCTPKVLTNQGGRTHQYIDHVVCFNTRDSHHRLNKHMILYVFRAPRHDSLVPLNQYKYFLYYKPYCFMCLIIALVILTACLRVWYSSHASIYLVHQPLTYTSSALMKH